MTTEVLTDRAQPCDLQAERALLGAVLYEADKQWADVASRVRADDFYRHAHRRIFLAMAGLSAARTAIDFVTLQSALRTSGELEECGGPAYLASLVDGVPAGIHVAEYAAIVREKSRMRSLIAAGTLLVGEAYAAEESAALLIDAGVRRLFLLADTTETEPQLAGQAAMAYAALLDEDRPGDVLSTGYIDLDEMLDGGLRTSEMTILAGRPGSGKTSLGLAMALGLAKAQQPVVFFTLEMRVPALASRLIAWTSRVDQGQMRRRMVDESAGARIAQGLSALADVPLWLQESATTLMEVAAWCRRLKAERGVRCAVVDYLQLLTPEGRHASREAEVASITKGLKRIAQTEGLAVVALSQLSRASDARSDKRPHLSDLRESGSQEQETDVALLLFRAEMHKPTEENRGLAEVIVAKNRQGSTGTVKLAFIAAYGGLFENLAR